MQLHELELFARAYEARSFTVAARESFVSRQAMSKTIAHLEAQMGALFMRQARGVAPTALADAIYPHVARLLAERDQILNEARLRAEGMRGVFALLVDPSVMVTLPPGVFDAYRAARPGVELEVGFAPSLRAGGRLANREADAVLTTPVDIPGTVYDRVDEGPLLLAFAERAFEPEQLARMPSGAQGGRRADREALAGKRVFGMSPDNYVEQKLAPYLEAHGLDVWIDCGLADVALIRNEMESGRGGLIIERRSAQRLFDAPGFVLFELTGSDAPQWDIGLAYFPDSDAAGRAADLAAFMRSRFAC